MGDDEEQNSKGCNVVNWLLCANKQNWEADLCPKIKAKMALVQLERWRPAMDSHVTMMTYPFFLHQHSTVIAIGNGGKAEFRNDHWLSRAPTKDLAASLHRIAYFNHKKVAQDMSCDAAISMATSCTMTPPSLSKPPSHVLPRGPNGSMAVLSNMVSAPTSTCLRIPPMPWDATLEHHKA